MSKNFLITGGLGFIGSELYRQLISRDDVGKVLIVDNDSKNEGYKQFKNHEYNIDLTNQASPENLRAIIDHHQIDVVFGLAALIGGIKYFHDHPADILHQNNLITGNTLEGIRLSERKPGFVYVSSSMIYEANENFPTPEDDIKYIPYSAYGFSKLVGNALCEAYYDQYKIDYVICAPFNSYGCLEYPKEVGVAHVVPDLIKKILDGQGTQDNPLEILGNGKQIRCYTHVSDICDGIITAALNTDKWYTTYNISSPKAHTVNEVAQLIWSKIHGDKPLYCKYLPQLIYDVQKRIPDVSKAKKELNWSARYVLEDKIDEVIEWVKSVNS